MTDNIKLPPLPEPDHFAFHDFGQGIWIEGGPTGEPFYSAQQVQELMREAVRLHAQAEPAAQQPLTDEQAASLAKQLGWDTMPERFPLIVRAVEQAHGIGVKP